MAGAGVRPAPGEAGELDWLRARVAELEAMHVPAEVEAGAATRAWLQALLESSPAGIAIWGSDDRLVAFNSQYRDIFFRGREHMVSLGQSFTEQSRRFVTSGQAAAIDGISEDFLHQRERRRRTPGEPFEQQVGERRILSRESRTPEGGTISVYMDITPIKQAEDALRLSEERLRALYESAGVGIVVLNAEGNPLDFNGAFRAMLGYAAEELHSKTFDDYTHPEDLDDTRAAAAEMLAGYRDQFSLERRYVRKNGQVIWGRMNAARLRGSGVDGGFCVAVIEDITAQVQAAEALRESEERFRAMADTMPALLWMDDADGRCVFVNKTWLDYTGRAMEEELGLGWAKAVHPEDVTGAVTIETDARRNRRPFTEVYRLRRADGEYRWFLDTGTPRFGGDGTFLGFIGTLLDITDQRRLEAELHQAQKVEAIGQLTGGVAHDFNNLLTVISGNLELAASRVEDARVQTMLRLAMDAAERGAALTQRLLAFGRRQALLPQALELAELVTGMSELLRRTLGRTIEIAISAPSGLWPALVDRNQLENALLNLAINARDAMADGGRLTIETANCEVAEGEISELKPGRYVALTVIDSGHGMTPEVREKAVQPFFTTKEPGKGSGLGLSMVYGFVKQSGGHLRIDSEVGRGTTIRMLLPVASRSHMKRPPVRGEDDALGFLPGSALVVDDDPDVLHVAVSMLESIGYRVTTAVDGASALTWIAEGGPFDLLLTDIVLPGGMNGVQLAASVAERLPGMKILLMSGYAERALDETGFSAPLLNKPFRRRELVGKLREIFAG